MWEAFSAKLALIFFENIRVDLSPKKSIFEKCSGVFFAGVSNRMISILEADPPIRRIPRPETEKMYIKDLLIFALTSCGREIISTDVNKYLDSCSFSALASCSYTLFGF